MHELVGIDKQTADKQHARAQPGLLVADGVLRGYRAAVLQGADPWAVDKLGGRTALHYAARSDNPEILQLLVEAAGSSGPVHFPNRPNTR